MTILTPLSIFQGYDVVLTATQEPFYGKITCVDSKFIPPVQCQKGKGATSLKLNENHLNVQLSADNLSKRSSICSISKKESTTGPTYNPPVTQKPPVTYTQPNTYAPKPTEPWNGEFPKGSLQFPSPSSSVGVQPALWEDS